MSQYTLMRAVKFALEHLGWKYKILSGGNIEAKIGMSIWSFGEKLFINIPSNGQVNVKSVGDSSIYHDKNKSNVTKFLTQLREVTLSFAIAESKTDYQKALQNLKSNPTNANLRLITLELGRIYSNLTREETGVTIFDEIALMNDINAACAGATVLSNSIQCVAISRTIEQRLNNLKELKEKEVINETEYNSKRQKILDDI